MDQNEPRAEDELVEPPAGLAPAAAPPQPVARAGRRLGWAGLALEVLLLALIAAGVYFRFSWTNWSEGTNLHPDEYGLTNTLTQLRIPATLGEYFNTRISLMSPYQKYALDGTRLDPSPQYPVPDNRMRWGQWPLTIIRFAAEQSGNTGYDELRLMGRRLSALADTLALGVIFLIGAALFGRRVGLMAAALSALAVMQIQQSHFMTADNFATLFTMLTLYCAVKVVKGGGWTWYGLFGVFFGMALASRINLAPLAAEIVVAAVIAYADDWTKGKENPTRLVREAGLRLALAGAAAFLTFRVTQPMSFRAEKGDTTLLTLHPNLEWTESMQVASAESSGEAGGPPAEQWTNRPALIFPWINMVVWGLGLPLGLAAWAGLLWATWRVFKSRDDLSWRLHLVPLTWAGGYFLFMGTRWVKSIRYFLPIYPVMALFAAWAIFALWEYGKNKGNRGPEGPNEEEPLARMGAGTKTRLIPFRPLSQNPLGSLRRYAQPAAVVLGGVLLLGTLAWAWGFTSIYRNTNTRVAATRWIYQNIDGQVNLEIATSTGSYHDPLPMPDGLPLGSEAPYTLQFTAHVTGTLTAISLAHIRSDLGPDQGGQMHVALSTEPDGSQPLAEADIVVAPTAADVRGQPASAKLGPAALEKGKRYFLVLTVPAGQSFELHGTAVANEDWDEAVPVPLDGRDPFGGLYSGPTIHVRWIDNEDKRAMYFQTLAQSDYVTLDSQRGLWSSSRLPNTYPMTIEYYRALFDGRLGFDLVAEFQSPIQIGPLQISDVAATWAWGQRPQLPKLGPDYPFDSNILSAEEAFSVYDHAPVWIFKKRADFNLLEVQRILGAIDLTQVVNQGPRDATRAPTLIKLPPDRLAEQRAGGTWSEMFDVNSLLNRYEFLGVVAWYLALLILGWLALPLAFITFRGLEDRGYALTRTLALLLTAWMVWMAGSFRVLPFTRGTIALAYLLLAIVSGVIYWRRRQEINAWLRAHKRYILAVEALALGLFVFDLLIRLGNPDLWHPSKGGEKPMVFSFFNAVLKSTSFPPYNPWLAGYYLNYYYYGFVIVGLPVKFLSLVPSFAYNLILPTLFSLTGMNAFAGAFNLVAAVGAPSGEGEVPARLMDSTPPVAEPAPLDDPALAVGGGGDGLIAGNGAEPELVPAPYEAAPPTPPYRAPARPNPYVAGVAAALLVVVLGNLAQIRTFVVGFENAADHEALRASFVGDNPVGATLNGLWRVFTHETTLPVGTDSLYWDASRIVADLSRAGQGEITEFPFFTFLYADLHAHMMDMPFTLLSLAWAISYVLLRARQAPADGGGERRSWLEWTAIWAVGGLALGAARATNTWDLPLFLALGLAAVAAGEWLREPRLSRGLLFQIAWRTALLVLLAYAFYHPFDQWFAAAYSQVKRFTNVHTPISAYLYVHGLFLFILVSFLALETRRWLAETPATVLTEAGDWLPIVVLVLVAVAVVMAVFWYLEVPAGMVAVPIMAWAGLLLLRPGAAMPLGKKVVLFLLGTALAVTLFVELFALEGDRMNTIFKFYIQVWVLLSVAGGAALAWVVASAGSWSPRWRLGWTGAFSILVAGAALYTLTATAAKVRDRFPAYTADAGGCQALPGMPLPYERGLEPDQQPLSLDGLDYMTWSAYCDHDSFLPLVYDYGGIRWMQDNVQGSPVIAEAQSFDLYRMSSRYTWNTGLPDVVGWDYHTRQHNAAIPTQFITDRGNEITIFYMETEIPSALQFIRRYDVRYIVVGPMEQAYYAATGGLAKFDEMVAQGSLSIAYRNPGTVIYSVNSLAAGQ